MNFTVIKNEHDYERVMSEIDHLIDLDPTPESPEGGRLQVLSLLAESYEKETCSESIVDPIEAIRFRMEQQGLSQADLAPFLGGRARVSEVLSGKRPLSLAMIRSLHTGLGIPAKSLIREPVDRIEIEWERFPYREMVRRGWLEGVLTDTKAEIRNSLETFFERVGGANAFQALFRKSERSGRPMDKHALAAWTARVINRTSIEPLKIRYRPGTVTLEVMREIVRLSDSSNGPLHAKDYLGKLGISFVVEQSLPKTYLDGAAIMPESGNPIIGLTLRYDRIDNFWFCLMHELAHISLHLDQSQNGIAQFYDDLDVKQTEDPKELEADDLACEALIPGHVWRNSPVPVAKSKESIARLASELHISPAIIAGRLRKELNSYHVYNDLVGHGQVRHLFLNEE